MALQITPAIEWKPQKNSAQGDFVAEAFLKLLSRGSDNHALSEPELLVRETAQNSWDARRSKTSEVSMDFTVRTVDKGNPVRTALSEFFSGFTGLPAARQNKIPLLTELTKALKSPKLSLLYVSDRGTFGLGGPTDASIAVDRRGTDRYVKFLLNIGDANTETTAGGAYGLGRSVFWRMSECSTAIVYSRCDVGGRYESRLIGLSLTKNFALDKRNHTGRHWWTSKSEGQPVVGTSADRWAKQLGFAQLSGSDTGTAVLVVSPFAPAGPLDLARAIARSIEFHLWPKYVAVKGRRNGPPMQFTVRINDELISVRDREGLAATPLISYIKAFETVLKDMGGDREAHDGIIRSAPIDYQFKKIAYPNRLGRLAATVIASTGSVGEVDDESLESPIDAALNSLGDSVALLRDPDLVVAYRSVEPPADAVTKIAGVFKSSEEANRFFRASETSTHSEWDSGVIPSPDGLVIKKFHGALLSQMRTWFPPGPVGKVVDVGCTLAIDKIAEQLGAWLGGWEVKEGDNPGEEPGDEGGGGGTDGGGKRQKSSLSIAEPELAVEDGVVVNKWKLKVSHSGPFSLVLELKEAGEDGRSVRTPTEARGARPALRLVASDHRFSHRESGKEQLKLRFQDGERSMNTIACTLDVRPKEEKGTVAFEVLVVCDQGTVPVLGAEVKDGAGPA